MAARSPGRQSSQKYRRDSAADPFRDGRLIRPPGLKPEVSAVWSFYAKRLKDVGRVASVDTDILRKLCEVEVDCRAYRAKLDAEGAVESDGNGRRVPSPYVKMLRESTLLWCKLLQDLGLRPLTRGAHAPETLNPPGEPSDDLADFKAQSRKLRVVGEV